MRPLAIVTGVGPGTGSAIAKRLSDGGFRVAMLARDSERLNAFARLLPHSLARAVDVADTEAFTAVIAALIEEFGPPKIVVHNAVGGAFGDFLSVEPAMLERNFQINVMALLHLARATTPIMAENGGGALVVTGNTSALRGRANFAAFAPTKAAQRILAESIARQMGPKGVHVAYVVIDAVIDLAWTRARYPDAKDDFFIKPEAIAAEVWHLAHQDRSAWSFLHEIRPFGETW